MRTGWRRTLRALRTGVAAAPGDGLARVPAFGLALRVCVAGDRGEASMNVSLMAHLAPLRLILSNREFTMKIVAHYSIRTLAKCLFYPLFLQNLAPQPC